MADKDVIIDEVLCDLKEEAWNQPCQKTNCVWNLDCPKYCNCFLFYKHFLRDKSHTLYEIAKLMRLSHTTVKQIETAALEKLKQNDLLAEFLSCLDEK